MRSASKIAIGAAATLATLGCGGNVIQSALHPAGPAAADIAWLWWFMLIAFTAVFALVMLLLVVAIRRGGRATDDDRNTDDAPPLGASGFIIAGGIALPIVVLSVLFVLTLKTAAALQQPRAALTVHVVGRMWWWEIRYPEHGVVTANEIHIPAGMPVRLELTSADVIHSFWVPRLHGKRDLVPGLTNEFWIEAEQPGVFRGQCAEYCGTQHANMSFEVIAHEPAEFQNWLSERSAAAARPVNAVQRGADVFLKAGCGQCHTVRGTRAVGNVGPDLTHFGSRRMLAAAMLPNTRANVAGWVVDPQAIKPGVRMPRTALAGDDLHALTLYLESLR